MESISIMFISAGVSVVAAIWAMNRDSKKDTKTETETTTSLQNEIKYISRGVEDIKYDTRSLTSTISGLNDRLIRVEESTKHAHNRLDKIPNSEVL